MDTLREACQALAEGRPVLLFDDDGREAETDMVVASEHASAAMVRTLREEAGGLVCTAVAPEHHQLLGLPYLADMVAAGARRHPVLAHLVADDIRYDPSRSSFSITINHRDTYTGIPDADRSTTIRALARFLRDTPGMPSTQAQRAFGAQFRAPGHCILLNGAPGGLAVRQGHTELSIELARQAGVVPCTTICEMLGKDGRAKSRKEAQAYARREGLVFLTGKDVVQAWRQTSMTSPALEAA